MCIRDSAGKDGTQWTIKDDGYWYQDGKKTEFKAKGDKGDPGEPGTPGTPGEPGQPGTPGDPGEDGDTYIPGEDGFWYKNEVKPENKTEMTWIIPGVDVYKRQVANRVNFFEKTFCRLNLLYVICVQ